MEEKLEKKAFYKKKLFIIPVMLGLTLMIVSAAVILGNVHASVGVAEAIVLTTDTVSLTAYPGETIKIPIHLQNKASVDLTTELTFVESEDGNVNGVTYTSDSTKTVTVPANSEIDAEVNLMVDQDSVIGDIEGDVSVSRVKTQ